MPEAIYTFGANISNAIIVIMPGKPGDNAGVL